MHPSQDLIYQYKVNRQHLHAKLTSSVGSTWLTVFRSEAERSKTNLHIWCIICPCLNSNIFTWKDWRPSHGSKFVQQKATPHDLNPNKNNSWITSQTHILLDTYAVFRGQCSSTSVIQWGKKPSIYQLDIIPDDIQIAASYNIAKSISKRHIYVNHSVKKNCQKSESKCCKLKCFAVLLTKEASDRLKQPKRSRSRDQPPWCCMQNRRY